MSEFSFYSYPAKTDVLHIHWPECVFWGRVSCIHPLLSHIYAKRMLHEMDRVRKHNGIVVWTAHNILPHEPLDKKREQIWRSYMRAFCTKVDLVISLTSEAEQKSLEAYPGLAGARRVVIPHPHYRTSYPPRIDKAQARGVLDIAPSDFVLASVGWIRPSKGVLEFARAFLHLAREDEKFLIAGECDDPSYLSALLDLAGNTDRLIVIPRHLSNTDIATISSASDLCVFNFRQILNSGSIFLALSYDVPVFAPKLGSLGSLAQELGPSWFVPLHQPLTENGLRTALDEARANRPMPGACAPIDAYDPESLSVRTLDAYRDTLARVASRLAPAQASATAPLAAYDTKDLFNPTRAAYSKTVVRNPEPGER